MEYSQISYYSFFGIKKVINLGDFVSEWIVYENSIPKYIIDLQTYNGSDRIINSLINKGQETIDSIIKKINSQQGTNLSLKNVPLFIIVKKVENIDLNLIPLPESWVKNIL